MAKRKIEKISRAGNKKEQICTTTWENNWSASIKANYVHPWASQVVLIVKNLPANTGDIRDTGSIPGLGRTPVEEYGNPFQYSCLKNPMDRRAWRATITKSQTQLK